MSQSYFDKLECLKRIDEHVDKDFDYCQRGDYAEDFNIVKQALQNKTLIERCWEIVVKKQVPTAAVEYYIKVCKSNEEILYWYNQGIQKERQLTETELNTLKE